MSCAHIDPVHIHNNALQLLHAMHSMNPGHEYILQATVLSLGYMTTLQVKILRELKIEGRTRRQRRIGGILPLYLVWQVS
jgi:hypothetical protein